MVDLSFYESRYGIISADAAFEHFVGTLQNYYDADYYVDWRKVFEKLKPFRFELSLLSALCDEPDKEEAARELLREYPKVIKAFPILMACRNTVEIVDNLNEARVTSYNFKNAPAQLTAVEIERYVKFLTTSGVLALLGQINSVPDYVTGVEVGMDTNGRKNRGGQCGVKAISPFVEEALRELPFLRAKAEATFDFLTLQGCSLPDAFRNERWDWAFWIKDAPHHLALMEVNHYGSSGSKLKAIARDYTGRHKSLAAAGIGFIWVTDGEGWRKSQNALREAFNAIEHLVNIRLAKDGQLKWALQSLLSAHIKREEEHAA